MGGLSELRYCNAQFDVGEDTVLQSSYILGRRRENRQDYMQLMDVNDTALDALFEAAYNDARNDDCLQELIGCTIYQAATFDAQGNQILHNNGHLGCLDSPECGDRVFGNFVYSNTPKA